MALGVFPVTASAFYYDGEASGGDSFSATKLDLGLETEVASADEHAYAHTLTGEEGTIDFVYHAKGSVSDASSTLCRDLVMSVSKKGESGPFYTGSPAEFSANIGMLGAGGENELTYAFSADEDTVYQGTPCTVTIAYRAHQSKYDFGEAYYDLEEATITLVGEDFGAEPPHAMKTKSSQSVAVKNADKDGAPQSTNSAKGTTTPVDTSKTDETEATSTEAVKSGDEVTTSTTPVSVSEKKSADQEDATSTPQKSVSYVADEDETESTGDTNDTTVDVTEDDTQSSINKDKGKDKQSENSVSEEDEPPVNMNTNNSEEPEEGGEGQENKANDEHTKTFEITTG